MSFFKAEWTLLTRLFDRLGVFDDSPEEYDSFDTKPEYLWEADVDIPPSPRLQEQKLLFFHELTRALYRGCHTPGPSSRPGLPLEIVCTILQYAECALLSKSRSITTVPPSPAIAKGSTDRETVVIVQLPPLDAVALHRIARIKLVTLSRDQGWVGNRSAGNWTWFEVAVQGPDGELREVDGEPAVWKSHENFMASRVFTEHREGTVFGPEHPLWRAARVGDVVVGRARAWFAGWENTTARADFIVWEYFDPLASAVL